MGMSIEEAIRRLVDVAKTLDPDSNTYIAFRMAVEALWAQERQEDDGSSNEMEQVDLIDRQAAIDAFDSTYCDIYARISISN